MGEDCLLELCCGWCEVREDCKKICDCSCWQSLKKNICFSLCCCCCICFCCPDDDENQQQEMQNQQGGDPNVIPAPNQTYVDGSYSGAYGFGFGDGGS